MFCPFRLQFFAAFLLGFLRTRVLVSGQPLTPPYFNLAEGRRVTATATCGEGVDEPELYCKLVGASVEKGDVNINLIQGQVSFLPIFRFWIFLQHEVERMHD